MVQIKALVIGATGYIGGSVLVAYCKKHPEIQYTAIVRNPKDNKALEALGVRVVQGSNTDQELIELIASEHDIVINCADADDLPLAKAIIKGLSTRARAGGGATKKPIYIHTSGTGVVIDEPSGEFKDIKIYDDANPEDIKSIHPLEPHREIDLTVFGAGEEGLIDTYIIAPSTIYGTGSGPVRNMSQQVNELIRTAIKHKQVLQVGPGTNVWDNVHIDDLADLYALVLDDALSGRASGASPWERFYFGSADVHVWGDVCRDLAVRLHERGLVETEEVRPVDAKDHQNLLAVASNSRTRANRGKGLGWKPHGPSLKDTLDEEITLTTSKLAA